MGHSGIYSVYIEILLMMNNRPTLKKKKKKKKKKTHAVTEKYIIPQYEF